MIFDDSSSEEEEEEDDDLEVAMMMILNEDFRRPQLGSQFGRAWINRDRVEGHAKITRDYFNQDAIYPETIEWRNKILGLNFGGVHRER